LTRDFFDRAAVAAHDEMPFVGTEAA